MLTVTSSLAVLALLVGCLHGGAAAKNQCPDSVGAVVAVLTTKVMDLMGQLEKSQDHVTDLEAGFQSSQDKLLQMEDKLQATEAEVEQLKSGSSKHRGAVYVRWGHKTCPEEISTLVYSGLAGGKLYSQKGSGTNRLCLTTEPKYDPDTETPPKYTGHVYGAEYEVIPGVHDRDVPCALCRTNHSAVFMIPGTNICPDDHTTHYTGHLASGYYDHFASDYVCLDKANAESESSKTDNSNGLLFYYDVSICGSLPCPPYENNKVMTCVVCSK